MQISKERTAEARAKTQIALDYLDYIFDAAARYRGIVPSHGSRDRLRPVRTREGCPPARDDYGKRRHLKRKRARAARRRNRG